MSAPLVIRAGAATDRGRHRETNEDSLVVTRTMCAVADGMGGHEAGEVASAMAVRTLGGSALFSSRRPAEVEVPAEPEPPEDVARFRERIEREMKLDPEIPAEALVQVRKLRAVGSGPVYPRSAAAARMRSRVAGASWSGRLYALDTVVGETPSSAAREASVVLRLDMTATLPVFNSLSFDNNFH